MSIMDNLKHLVLTEDDPALKPAAEPVKVAVDKARIPTPGAPKVTFDNTVLLHRPVPIPSPSDARTVASFGIAKPGDPVEDGQGPNTFAQTLKAKTDFDQTDIGKQVAHEMKPLEGIASLTEADKIKIALKAGAEEGLTADKIIAAFDSLLQTLESENSGFQNAVAAATQSGPEAIKAQIQAEADKIKDLQAQIAASQNKQQDLSTELIKSSTKIQTNTMQFSVAYEARKSELTSSKSHYQSILAGIK